MPLMTHDEKLTIAKKIVRMSNKIGKIDEVLKPYTKGDTPTNNVYRWYGDGGKIGQLLRLKDDYIQARHDLRVSLGIFPF